MRTREFLERILPPNNGDFFAAHVDQAGGYKQSRLNDVDAVERYIEARRKRNNDIYVATGVYDGNRHVDKTIAKKALYLDIDCGEGKPYVDKQIAVKELWGFCKRNKLHTPNVLVDSGGGIHAYWALSEPTTLDKWQQAANALKDLCIAHGLHADHAITGDPARIMRVPGTENFKDQNSPRPCQVIYETAYDYTIENLIGQLVVDNTPLGRLGTLADNDDLTGGQSDYPFEKREHFAGPMFAPDGCGVFRHSMETGGQGQHEPLWMQQLHVLAFCVDGAEYIHDISKGDMRYNETATEKKFAERVRKAEQGKVGPTRCATMSHFESAICKACPHNGKITTPLQLAIRHEIVMPVNYKVKDDGTYKANFKGDDEVEWVRVLSFKVENYQAFFGNDGSGTLHVFDVVTKHKRTPVRIAGHKLHDSRETAKTFDEFGVMLFTNENTEIKHLMSAWYKQLSDAQKVKTTTKSLGWSKVNDTMAFTTGSGTYIAGGGQQEVNFVDRRQHNNYVPQGDGTKWLRIAHRITAQQNHVVNAVVLSAFAAPLVHFTGVDGTYLSIVSRKSGTGKTTALKVAQAVWGNPKYCVKTFDDTPKAVAKEMGFLNSLPAYWDELRMSQQVKQFVSLIFSLSSGRERDRLRVDTSKQEVGGWETMVVSASNESIADHVTHTTAGDAGQLRVLELEAPMISHNDPELQDMVADLRSNYGHIGDAYAKYLVGNYDAINEMIRRTRTALTKKLGLPAEERFRIATVAALMVAAQITVKLRLVSVDLPSFSSFLATQIKRAQHEKRLNYEDLSSKAPSLVLEFYEDNHDKFVQSQHMPGGRMGQRSDVGAIYHQPDRDAIYGVWAKDDKKLRVSTSRFREWLRVTNQGESLNFVVKELKALGGHVGKASITTGTVRGSGLRTQCVTVDLTSSAFSSLMDDDPDALPNDDLC